MLLNNGLYSRSHQVILTYYVVSFPSLESSYCTNSGMCDVYMMYKYDVISNGKIKKGKCQLGDAKKKYDYSSYMSKNIQNKQLNEISTKMIHKI